MTEDQLKHIRQKVETARRYIYEHEGPGNEISDSKVIEYFDLLLAEIERLSTAVDAKIIEAGEMRLEIERHMREKVALAGLVAKERDEVELLRAALQALHDWNVEYARINNLFNDDGTPATFHELLEARRALEHKS